MLMFATITDYYNFIHMNNQLATARAINSGYKLIHITAFLL